MDGRFYITSSEKAESIAGINRKTTVQRPSPLPAPRLIIFDLQSRDRLSKQQSIRAEIGMPSRPQAIIQFLDLLGGELAVFHVPKVRFVMGAPFV
jgi:hypothetical protein